MVIISYILKALKLSIFQKKKKKKFVGNKYIITDLYRIQAHDSIMCGYFCIGFIDFILQGKRMTNNAKKFQ